MKVTVILITYNQEIYIRQAIESILMQRFNGDLELIVADDCSTDATLNIIKSFEKVSPFPFIYLPREHNLGHPKNYQRAFAASDGEFIAILEGDDYWTSPFRLQKHVDFLNIHRECVLSMNRLIIYFQEKSKFEIQDWVSNSEYEYITSQEMALGNRLGNLSACVIRKEILCELNDKFYDLDVDDWILGIALGQYGLLAKLIDILSVYRKHDNGQWSRLSSQDSTNIMIDRIEKYDIFFEYRYKNEFETHIHNLKSTKPSKTLLQKIKWCMPPFLWILLKFICPPFVSNLIKKN